MLRVRRGPSRAAITGAILLLAAAAASSAVAQDAGPRVRAGDAETSTFNPLGALRHYEAALALSPRLLEALGKAARAAADVGEQATGRDRSELYQKSEGYARRAVDVDPRDAEAHFHLARALGLKALSVGVRERVRYATEIRVHALQALSLDSRHPGALHIMGAWNAEIMRLSGMERFLARKLLGGGVFREANWKDAVSYMEQAVEIDPDRLTHRLDLAKIYADIGEKAKAREQFERVVAGRQTDFNDPKYKREAAAALQSLK